MSSYFLFLKIKNDNNLYIKFKNSSRFKIIVTFNFSTSNSKNNF